MPVEHHVDAEAIQRLLEAARSEERIDLGRLALPASRQPASSAGSATRGPPLQARQRRLEFQRLLHGFADEGLDGGLAPGAERARAEPTGETLDAGDADAAQGNAVAVEHVHTDVRQDGDDLRFLPGLDVVIAQHGDRRDSNGRQLTRQGAGFLQQAVIDEIAAHSSNTSASVAARCGKACRTSGE